MSDRTTASYAYRTGGITSLYRHNGQMGIEDVKTGSSGTVTAFPIYDAHGNNVASLTRNGSSFSIGDRRTYDAWGIVRA